VVDGVGAIGRAHPLAQGDSGLGRCRHNRQGGDQRGGHLDGGCWRLHCAEVLAGSGESGEQLKRGGVTSRSRRDASRRRSAPPGPQHAHLADRLDVTGDGAGQVEHGQCSQLGVGRPRQ
jgi:hypothetical protein